MKGRITDEGRLEVWRSSRPEGEEWVEQDCPFAYPCLLLPAGAEVDWGPEDGPPPYRMEAEPCGDWCPHFDGEATYYRGDMLNSMGLGSEGTPAVRLTCSGRATYIDLDNGSEEAEGPVGTEGVIVPSGQAGQ